MTHIRLRSLATALNRPRLYGACRIITTVTRNIETWDTTELDTINELVRKRKDGTTKERPSSTELSEILPRRTLATIKYKAKKILTEEDYALLFTSNQKRKNSAKSVEEGTTVKPNPWSEEELQLLKEALLRQSYRTSWPTIQAQLPGRSLDSIVAKSRRLFTTTELSSLRRAEKASEVTDSEPAKDIQRDASVKKQWAKEEIAKLTEAVERQAGSKINWKLVSDALPGRSPKRCHYKAKLLVDEGKMEPWISRFWLHSDSVHLRKLLQEFQTDKVIPWEEIKETHFPNFSVSMLKQKSLDVSKEPPAVEVLNANRWTDEETQLLRTKMEEAKERWGWVDLVSVFPNRSPSAIRNKALQITSENHLQTLQSRTEWSDEESDELVKLVDAIAEDWKGVESWKSIAENFEGRTAEACRLKWTQLRKVKKLMLRLNRVQDWKADELERLEAAWASRSNGNGSVTWDQVSEAVGTRASVACSSKAYELVGKGLLPRSNLCTMWESRDLNVLIEQAEERLRTEGRVDWTAVKEAFPHRSNKACHRRFLLSRPTVRQRYPSRWRRKDDDLIMKLARTQATVDDILTALPAKPLTSVSSIVTAIRMSEGTPKSPEPPSAAWTRKEIEKLVSLRRKSLQADWLDIGRQLDRPPSSCYLKYMRVKRSFDYPFEIHGRVPPREYNKMVHWTPEEDYVVSHPPFLPSGRPDWSHLANMLPHRSLIQIRHRRKWLAK